MFPQKQNLYLHGRGSELDCFSKNYGQPGVVTGRAVFLEAQPETAAKSAVEAKPVLEPIHHERIEKDLKEALQALQLVKGEVQTAVIDDLRNQLQKLQKKYEQICIDRDGSLKELEKQLYTQLEPVLLKAAQHRLRKCKDMVDPKFEKEGLVFSFKGKEMTATLNENYEIESIKIGEVSIQYLVPMSLELFNERFGYIAVDVVRRINDRFNPKNLKVNAAGGHYDFSITHVVPTSTGSGASSIPEQDKVRKFTVTTQDLLEVKSEPDPQKQIRYLTMHKRFRDARKELGQSFKEARDFFGDKADLFYLLDGFKDLYNTSDNNAIDQPDTFEKIQKIDTGAFSLVQLYAWDTLLNSIKSFQRTKAAAKSLKDEASIRMLEGIDAHGGPLKVKEDLNLPNPGFFKWIYLDSEGKKSKEVNFVDEVCGTAVEYEQDKVARTNSFREDGSLYSEEDAHGVTHYYDHGKKTYLQTVDPLKKDELKQILFYDKGGNLLDHKAMTEEMSLAKLQKFFIDELNYFKSHKEGRDYFCTAVLFNIEYVKNFPQAKAILLKVAQLAPAVAFKYYGKYKGNLYANDILEAAAHGLYSFQIKSLMKNNDSFADLSEKGIERLYTRVDPKNKNVPFAKVLLGDKSNGNRVTYETAKFLENKTLKDLSKIQVEWLEPYWDRLKKPEMVLNGEKERIFRIGICVMIARNLDCQKKKVNPQNVQDEILNIIAYKEKYKDVPIFIGRNVVLAANAEMVRDMRNDEGEPYGDYSYEYAEGKGGDIHSFGKKGLQDAIKKQQNGKGSLEFIRPEKNEESLRNAKAAILEKIRTTQPPMTFFFNGHGGPDAIYLVNEIYNGNVGMSPKNPSEIKAIVISTMELADAYKDRLRKFPELKINDPTKTDVFIFSCCFNANFIFNFNSLVGNLPKPIMLGAGEYGQTILYDAYLKTGTKFHRDILGLDPDVDKTPTTLGNVFENELLTDENTTVLINGAKNRPTQIVQNEPLPEKQKEKQQEKPSQQRQQKNQQRLA